MKKSVVLSNFSKLRGKYFVKMQRLRLKEKMHDDMMEVERRKLAILEAESKPQLELKKRELSLQIVQGQVELLKELRTLGLSSQDAMKFFENLV